MHYMNRREIEKLLMAGSVSNDGEPGRALQSAFGSQIVKFVECAFVGNRAGDGDLALTQMGVVTSLSEFNELTFLSSIFTNNNYTRAGEGYAVKTGGSNLIIRDSCIFENVFAGHGVIQHFGSGSIEADNNLARYNGNNLTCEFIAQSSQSGLLRFDAPVNLTCIEPDALVCALNDTVVNPDSDAPSAVPSSLDGTLDPTLPGGPDNGSDMPSTIPTIAGSPVSDSTGQPADGSPAADSTRRPTKTLAPTPASQPGTTSPGGETTIAPASISSDSPSNVPSTLTVANGGVSARGVATSRGFLPLPFFHLYTISLVPFILLHLFS
jgi:hypothetical protein